MKIYSFQVTTGRKDGFIRVYHIPESFTLYDFKRFIENDLDFDSSQPSVFWSMGTDGSKSKQYSLFDTGHGAMDNITIDMLNKEGVKMLLYTFDFFNNRSLIIEFGGEAEKIQRKSYPLVFDSKADAPGQFEEKPIEEPLPKVISDIDDDEPDDDIDDDIDDDEPDDDEEFIDEEEE